MDNAAHGHLQAAKALAVDSPVGGHAYFLSQGRPVNCWQWINDILQLAELPPVGRSISRSAGWCIGWVLEWLYRLGRIPGEPRMTRFLAAQLASSHYFDITRAEADFGYRPLITIEQGMQRLAESLPK